MILFRHREFKMISDGNKIVLVNTVWNDNFRNILKNNNLKKDTMKGKNLQRVSVYGKVLTDSKIYSEKGFVKIDNGSMGWSHFVCFIVKINKSFSFDSFGEAPDKFLLNQLTKPIRYHKYEIQDKNSKICGLYCLFFLYNWKNELS